MFYKRKPSINTTRTLAPKVLLRYLGKCENSSKIAPKIVQKIAIRRRQLKLRGPLVVGKLHASVHQFASEELKGLNGFDSVLHELKIDGQFIDPWEKAILSR